MLSCIKCNNESVRFQRMILKQWMIKEIKLHPSKIWWLILLWKQAQLIKIHKSRIKIWIRTVELKPSLAMPKITLSMVEQAVCQILRCSPWSLLMRFNRTVNSHLKSSNRGVLPRRIPKPLPWKRSHCSRHLHSLASLTSCSQTASTIFSQTWAFKEKLQLKSL